MPALAVIGHPVAHSRSPAMQSAALAALGLGAAWSYGAIDVEPAGFAGKVRSLAAAGYAGLNVTVPHKRAALELAEAPSEVAREIGAANTLSFGAAGIRAHNTDAEGFLRSLPAPPRGRALVLGAGGAARAVVWALLREGAEVEVWNRTPERAAALCAGLGGTPLAGAAAPSDATAPPPSAATPPGTAEPPSAAAPPGAAAPPPGGRSAPSPLPDQAAYATIVNTTAVGLQGEDPFAHLPLDPGAFAPGQTVVDMVYGEVPSPLLAAGAAAGAAAVDGLEILVQQGALSLHLWTGLEPPLDVMRAAARG